MWLSGLPEEDDTAGTQPSSPAVAPEPPSQQQQQWSRASIPAATPPVRSSSERNDRSDRRHTHNGSYGSGVASASGSALSAAFPACSPTAASAASAAGGSITRSPSGSSLQFMSQQQYSNGGAGPTRSPISSPSSQQRSQSALSQSVSRVFPPNSGSNHSYPPHAPPHPPAAASAAAATSASATAHWPSFAFERQYLDHAAHAYAPPSIPWQSFSAVDGGGDESSVQHAIVAPTRNRIHQDTHADTTESKQGEPGSPSASSALDTYCAVCMSEGCDAFLLPCQHNFHAACILQWVESDHQVPQHRLSCPLCRQSIEQFVPLEAAGIEDRSGDMLERFLKVWEKHYMSRGPAPGAAGAGSGGAGGGAGGADDGEQLIKPGSTQEIDESQKQQTQQGLQSPQGSSTVIDTLSAANTNTESTAEQNAWQQLYQDVFFIPDSLPDDFIIPHAAAATGTDHVAEQMSMLQEEEQRRAIFRQDHHMAPTSAAAVAAGDNHANNIAAVDGGLTSGGGTGSSALGGSLGFLASTPFALLNSLLSAFKTSTGASGAMTPLRSPIAARRPVRPVQRILFPEASADEEGAESEHAIDSIRILEPDSSSSAASSASASSSAELETVPPPLSGSPTPSAMMPVFAGSVAGAATVVSQTLTYGRGAGALAPSPAYASIPAIAAYFTSYEMMKQELSLSPSLSSAAITGVDPRAALLNAESTAGYFAAAGTAGAISNVVKLTLSPGVISLAGAFASTAQISARMGIQFSVFEQTKNAFALYRHRRAGEDLNAAEVLMAASLGGIVAASVMYPIQHLIPVQHWAMTAPPPPPVAPAAAVPGAGFGPLGGGAAGGGGVAGALAKPTLLACLGRFLPACVATAVTYEYAYRFFRDRNRINSGTPLASPTHAALSSASSSSSSASSSSSSSSPPATALSSPVASHPNSASAGWLHSIASRTSSLLRSMGMDVGIEEAGELIPVRAHNAASEIAAADSSATTAAASMQLPPRVPTSSWPPRSASSSVSSVSSHSSSASPHVPQVRALGHAVPLMHHLPPGLTPVSAAPASAAPSHLHHSHSHAHGHLAPTRGHSTPSGSSIPGSASVHGSSSNSGSQRRPGGIAASSSFTLQVPSGATSSTLSRSASHPLLTMFHTRANSHSSASHNSLLEPW